MQKSVQLARSQEGGQAAPFELPELPFSPTALEPHISSKTLAFHHGKHHQAYVDNLNRLVAGTDLARLGIEDIVRKTADDPERRQTFNNAAQAWNHTFYWHSLAGHLTRPSGQLMRMIKDTFGSFDELCGELRTAGAAHFGSGWLWLVLDDDTLRVCTTPDADNPLVHGQTPLLTVDVWEHAYYLDHQNRRGDYLDGVISSKLNWDHATTQLARA